MPSGSAGSAGKSSAMMQETIDRQRAELDARNAELDAQSKELNARIAVLEQLLSKSQS